MISGLVVAVISLLLIMDLDLFVGSKVWVIGIAHELVSLLGPCTGIAVSNNGYLLAHARPCFSKSA